MQPEQLKTCDVYDSLDSKWMMIMSQQRKMYLMKEDKLLKITNSGGGVVYAIDSLLDIQTHDQAFMVSHLILFSL